MARIYLGCIDALAVTTTLNSSMIFSDFLGDVSMVFFFMNTKYQCDYKMGKTWLQFSGFRDLVTADGEPNSNRSRGYCIKETHSLSNHAIIEIVFTTKACFAKFLPNLFIN